MVNKNMKRVKQINQFILALQYCRGYLEKGQARARRRRRSCVFWDFPETFWQTVCSVSPRIDQQETFKNRVFQRGRLQSMRANHRRYEVFSNSLSGGVGIRHLLSSSAAQIIAADYLQPEAGSWLGATKCREPALPGIHAQAGFQWWWMAVPNGKQRLSDTSEWNAFHERRLRSASDRNAYLWRIDVLRNY